MTQALNWLRWFGHVMSIGEGRIPKKMLYIKMEGKRSRGRSRTRWIDQSRKDIEIRWGNWEEIQESGKWEKAGDFSVILDPYI